MSKNFQRFALKKTILSRTSNEYKLFDKVNHTNQRTPEISYNDDSIKVAISYVKIDEKGIEFFPQTQIFSSLYIISPVSFDYDGV